MTTMWTYAWYNPNKETHSTKGISGTLIGDPSRAAVGEYLHISVGNRVEQMKVVEVDKTKHYMRLELVE